MDTAIEDRVRKLVAEQCGVCAYDAASVTREKTLIEDLGFDSLDHFEFVAAVEDEFSIDIPHEDFGPLLTFGQVCDYVESRTATKSVTG